MQIIDTTSDLGFKTVFGEKPHLLMSLLNNFLPLPNPIVEIHYMTPEIVPEKIDGKNSIVDVRCKDSHGRHFIVEMQIEKQGSFIKRALVNTSKIYAKQLTKKDKYGQVQPVYSLNLLNHKIDEEDSWYHHYALTNQENPSKTIDQIHIVLIELPKWKKLNKFDLELPRDRWLVYFTEPNRFSMLTKEQMDRFYEISEAIDSLEPNNFTPEQIRAYELYLDNIRSYTSTISENREEGRAEGREELSRDMPSIIGELIENKISIEEISKKYNVSIEIIEEMSKAINK